MSVVFALATPASKSALCVFRVSGNGCLSCLKDICNIPPIKPRVFYNRLLISGGALVDSVGVVFFEGSSSYTGEDSFEIYAHGGLAVMGSVVELLQEQGFDEAGPGEFTKRAFLNNKLSLSEAESVVDVINASNKRALEASANSLVGGFSAEVFGFSEKIDVLRKYVEGSIDFSDEDYDFIKEGGVLDSLSCLCADFGGFVSKCYVSGEAGSKKMVIFVGPPNSGKSSLFNRLLGSDRALVSSTPGTTRDLIESEVFYNSLSFGVVDTAGLRDTKNMIEKSGITLALEKIKDADVVVGVFDDENKARLDGVVSLVGDKLFVAVLNKSDLGCFEGAEGFDFLLSAKTGDGIVEFKDSLSKMLDEKGPGDQKYFARMRHVRLFDRCLSSLENSMLKLKKGEDLDLAAEDLRLARSDLDEVVGIKTADSLLGDIFNDFCIGK